MFRTAALFATAAFCLTGTANAAPVNEATQGKRLYMRCASCHSLGAAGASKIGPNLQGVVGRKAGSLPGFAYSPAMKAKHFAWDAATLDRWLLQPSAVVPGTSMAFGGIPKPEDRNALITYLKANDK